MRASRRPVCMCHCRWVRFTFFSQPPTSHHFSHFITLTIRVTFSCFPFTYCDTKCVFSWKLTSGLVFPWQPFSVASPASHRTELNAGNTREQTNDIISVEKQQKHRHRSNSIPWFYFFNSFFRAQGVFHALFFLCHGVRWCVSFASTGLSQTSRLVRAHFQALKSALRTAESTIITSPERTLGWDKASLNKKPKKKRGKHKNCTGCSPISFSSTHSFPSSHPGAGLWLLSTHNEILRLRESWNRKGGEQKTLNQKYRKKKKQVSKQLPNIETEPGNTWASEMEPRKISKQSKERSAVKQNKNKKTRQEI